jgi:hypothetical protein
MLTCHSFVFMFCLVRLSSCLIISHFALCLCVIVELVLLLLTALVDTFVSNFGNSP